MNRTSVISAGLLATFAGAASADIVQQDAAAVMQASPTEAWMRQRTDEVHRLKLINQQVFDTAGDADNTLLWSQYNAGEKIVSLVWRLNTEVEAPMVLSDIRLRIVNENGDGVILSAFEGMNTSGAGESYSDVRLDLGELAVDIVGDGKIFYELFTAFDANPGAAEATFVTGSWVDMTVVPTPGALALLGTGGLLVARRRR